MLAAAATSAVFLVSYLVYHARVGSVRFTGTGAARPVYFTILGHAHGPGRRHPAAGSADPLPGLEAAGRPPPADRALDLSDLALRVGDGGRDLRDALPALPSRPDSGKIDGDEPVVRVAAVLLLAAIVLPGVLSACPLCKDATSGRGIPGRLGVARPRLLLLDPPDGRDAVRDGRGHRGVPGLARRRRRDRAALPAPAPVARLVPDSRGARS